MRVFDGVEMIYEISPIVFDELDLFQLNAIVDNREMLVAVGRINDSGINEILHLMDENGTDDEEATETETVTETEHEAEAVQDIYEEYDAHEILEDEILTVSVGDVIRFGKYDWLVLDVQGNRALVITEYVISQKPFHHTSEPVTWETSEIRQYLNSQFFSRFSQQNQARIATTTVTNNNNPLFGTRGGSDTIDRIFLLSIEEVVHYFGDSGHLARQQLVGLDQNRMWVHYSEGVINDAYNEFRSAYDIGGLASDWRLRSPGLFPDDTAYVSMTGMLIPHGSPTPCDFIEGVRPALWLYLDLSQQEQQDTQRQVGQAQQGHLIYGTWEMVSYLPTAHFPTFPQAMVFERIVLTPETFVTGHIGSNSYDVGFAHLLDDDLQRDNRLLIMATHQFVGHSTHDFLYVEYLSDTTLILAEQQGWRQTVPGFEFARATFRRVVG